MLFQTRFLTVWCSEDKKKWCCSIHKYFPDKINKIDIILLLGYLETEYVPLAPLYLIPCSVPVSISSHTQYGSLYLEPSCSCHSEPREIVKVMSRGLYLLYVGC